MIKLERVQAAKRDVEARRKNPADAGFLSLDEFFGALHSKAERYNATPQESVVMGGGQKVTMSPDEAWQRHQERDASGNVVGLVKLPQECRYLLAARAEKTVVGRNGISFSQSGERFSFRAGLAAFEHQEVTAYFDPELSDWLSVVTADNQVLTVPREAPISRFTATSEDLAASGGSVAVWNRTHSARLAQLRHNYAPPARGNIVSPVVAAVGREMAAHREAITAKAEARRQTATRAERVARERGLPLPANPGMAAAYEAIFARNEPTAHEHD